MRGRATRRCTRRLARSAACLLLLGPAAACATAKPAAPDPAVVNPPAFTLVGRSVADVRTDVSQAMTRLGYGLVVSQPVVLVFQKRPGASVREALAYGAGRVYQVTVTVVEAPPSVAVGVSPQLVTGSGGVATLPAAEIRAVTDALAAIPGVTRATP